MHCVLLLIKEGLYIIWCGVNRLGDIVVCDTSGFVNPGGAPGGGLLLTRRGETRVAGVGIVI